MPPFLKDQAKIVELLAHLDYVVDSRKYTYILAKTSLTTAEWREKLLFEMERSLGGKYTQTQIENKLRTLFRARRSTHEDFRELYRFGSGHILEPGDDLQLFVHHATEMLRLQSPRLRNTASRSRAASVNRERCFSSPTLSVQHTRKALAKKRKSALRKSNISQVSIKALHHDIQHQTSFPKSKYTSLMASDEMSQQSAHDSTAESVAQTIEVNDTRVGAFGVTADCSVLPQPILSALKSETSLSGSAGPLSEINDIIDSLRADNEYYRKELQLVRKECDDLKREKRSRGTLALNTRGDASMMEKTVVMKSNKIASLEKKLRNLEQLTLFRQGGPLPHTLVSGKSILNRVQSAHSSMVKQLNRLAQIDGLRFSDTRPVCNQLREADELIAEAFGTKEKILGGTKNFVKRGIDTHDTLRSLSGAAVLHWIFLQDFRMFSSMDFMPTSHHEAYKDNIRIACGEEVAEDIDVAARWSVILQEGTAFRDSFLPFTAGKLAHRLAGVIQTVLIFDNPEQSERLVQILSEAFYHALDIRTMISAGGQSYICTWPGPEACFEETWMVQDLLTDSSGDKVLERDMRNPGISLSLAPGLHYFDNSAPKVGSEGCKLERDVHIADSFLIAKALVII
ncbi:hypothetical protein EJ04DRAFT_602981 [Polyplosphaeria fusca]|uniref:Uncharacterized protein n=1 Tax=Polyplosphaeria fusca TaxID=682080 RepID=A0A9P4R0Y4_9PLEO|nr:hypothetical protein EJ04DRAFT_602981 [Polyplosphaeria fusca]